MSHSIGVVAPAHRPTLSKERDRMALAKATPPRRRPVIERLLAKVEHQDRGHATPCWIFMGSRLPRGYGMIGNGAPNGAPSYAHRVTYEHYVGTVPAGLEIDHICQQKACCNPDHLEAVTHLENVRRGRAADVARARHAARTHCKHGHEFTSENIDWYINSGGYRSRRCRICRRQSNKA